MIFGKYPIPSMYGIFTYIWLIFMVNVGKYVNIPYMDAMGRFIISYMFMLIGDVLMNEEKMKRMLLLAMIAMLMICR